MNNKISLIFLLIVVFFLGFLISKFGNTLTGRSIDVNDNLPSDYLKNEDFLVYDDKIILKIENAQVSNYESDSMEPFLGKGANGIVIELKNESEINVGDIVTFRKDDKLIVHRVIEKGADSEGIYFITKGDNNEIDDGKIRFDEIEHRLVGILY